MYIKIYIYVCVSNEQVIFAGWKTAREMDCLVINSKPRMAILKELSFVLVILLWETWLNYNQSASEN